MKKLVILEHTNLTTARKDIDAFTQEPYNEDNDAHISEWALGVAMNSYKVGEETTEDEFRQRCSSSKLQQTLDSMCEKGLIEAIWEDGHLTYRVRT